MKNRKRENGFVATSVLYSLVTILAVTLLVILNNVTTTRKIGLRFADEAKDDLLKYEIAYDKNGGVGEVIPNTVIFTGKSAELSKNTYTRNKYDFIGWSTTPTGDVEFEDEQTVEDLSEPNTILTLYAVWKEKTYEVIYDFKTNGGNSLDSVTNILSYKEGEAINLNLKATTDRAGYKFLGWTTSAAGRTPITSRKMQTSPITLYAIFRKSIPVTLIDYEGTKKITTKDYCYLYNKEETATSITLPDLNTTSNKCGAYDKVGWSTDTKADASVEYSQGAEYSTTTSTTLYGLYKKDEIFWLDPSGGSTDGTSVTNTRYKNGSGSVVEPEGWNYTFKTVSRPGYTFLEWNENNGSGSTGQEGTVYWECETMYSAIWW